MKNTLKLVAGLALSALFLSAHAQTSPGTMAPPQDGKMMDGKMKGKMKDGKMMDGKMKGDHAKMKGDKMGGKMKGKMDGNGTGTMDSKM